MSAISMMRANVGLVRIVSEDPAVLGEFVGLSGKKMIRVQCANECKDRKNKQKFFAYDTLANHDGVCGLCHKKLSKDNRGLARLNEIYWNESEMDQIQLQVLVHSEDAADDDMYAPVEEPVPEEMVAEEIKAPIEAKVEEKAPIEEPVPAVSPQNIQLLINYMKQMAQMRLGQQALAAEECKLPVYDAAISLPEFLDRIQDPTQQWNIKSQHGTTVEWESVVIYSDLPLREVQNVFAETLGEEYCNETIKSISVLQNNRYAINWMPTSS
jgi:hypothetical protein